jgi:hypothetical protein
MQEHVQQEKRLGLWESEPALDSAILGFERDGKTLEKRPMLLNILEREHSPKVTVPCRDLNRARSLPRVEAVEAISTMVATG